MTPIRKFLLIAGTIASFSVVAAEANTDADPLDLSSETAKVEKMGISTQPDVDALAKKAKALFDAGDCEAAIPVLTEYALKANRLANMIASTLNPFISADRDDQKYFPDSKREQLIPLQNLSNDYKHKRNIAFAMKGECLVKLGEHRKAIPVLMKTLDLLKISDDHWWEKTRNNLLTVIEVSPT